MSERPLLSLVIPTQRSRLDDACRAAVQSALGISSITCEIILHVEDDEQGVDPKVFVGEFADSRIKLKVCRSSLTMTENWDRAVEMAAGEYLCLLGDDDAVMPEIGDVTLWAKKEKLDNVIMNGNAQYYWPSFPLAEKAGTLVARNITGKAKFPDIARVTKANASGPKMRAYNLQPEIYGGIVKKKAIDRMRKVTGRYFGGIIPDVYFAVAIAPFIQRYAVLDFPFYIPGSSKKANTSKMTGQNCAIDAKNYRKENWPQLIPDTTDYASLYAYSKWLGLKESKQTDLVAHMVPSHLYAHILLNSPHSMARFKNLISGFRLCIQKRRESIFVAFMGLFAWVLIELLIRANLKMPVCMHAFQRNLNGIYKEKPQVLVTGNTILEAIDKLRSIILQKGISPIAA